MDPAAAWATSMVRTGERALELRQAGHTWGAIADQLQIGDARTAQRAAAMFLAADVSTRTAAGGLAGRTQPAAGTKMPPAGQSQPGGRRELVRINFGSKSGARLLRR